MIRQLGWYLTKKAFAYKKTRRLLWMGAAGAAATGAGMVFAGAGAAVAGAALWRRLGARREELRGQVVLITGSSRGLGFALAQEFARLGAKLVLCARDEVKLEAAREHLARAGAEVLAVRCDLIDYDDVQRLVEQAKSHFGRIDILVNNAGVIQVGPLASQTVVDFEEAMDVIFWGTVYPTLAVLPQMLARGSGHIANITSIGGKVSVPHLLPYCCAKFAAVGFSEGLRAEVAKEGVQITTVVPGLLRTGSHLNAYFKGDHRAEFAWFSLGATLPVVSMEPHRAAGKIVDAIRRGRAELVLTPQAKLLSIAHGLCAGTTVDALGLVNRFLPTGVAQDRHTGRESETRFSHSFVTALGRQAAEELNQNGVVM